MSNESKPIKGDHWINNKTGIVVEIVDITNLSIHIRHPSGILDRLTWSIMTSTYSKVAGTGVSAAKKVSSKNKAELPVEVFNNNPIDHKKAWKELKRACSN